MTYEEHCQLKNAAKLLQAYGLDTSSIVIPDVTPPAQVKPTNGGQQPPHAERAKRWLNNRQLAGAYWEGKNPPAQDDYASLTAEFEEVERNAVNTDIEAVHDAVVAAEERGRTEALMDAAAERAFYRAEDEARTNIARAAKGWDMMGGHVEAKTLREWAECFLPPRSTEET